MNREVETLCAAIGMPQEVVALLKQTKTGLSDAQEEEFAERLCGAESNAVADELHGRLTDDANSVKILFVMLRAATVAKKSYGKAGIPTDIFDATMGCFSRFVREYRIAHGVFGFDRWWWTPRQLGLKLFRLGTLEYELTKTDGETAVSIHIPSDADLSQRAVDLSLAEMRRFFERYAGGIKEYYCRSWLLSPALARVLPSQSKIICFAKRFRIKEIIEDDESYKIWVYRNSDLLPEEFPENTTLQRNLKPYVLSGGKVGEAYGILE